MINQNFNLKTFVEIEKKYDGKFSTLIGDNLFTAFDNKLFKVAIK